MSTAEFWRVFQFAYEGNQEGHRTNQDGIERWSLVRAVEEGNQDQDSRKTKVKTERAGEGSGSRNQPLTFREWTREDNIEGEVETRRRSRGMASGEAADQGETRERNRQPVMGTLHQYMTRPATTGQMEQAEIQEVEGAPPQPTPELVEEEQPKETEGGAGQQKPGASTRRKQTETLARAPKKITIARKKRRTIKLTFIPLEYWGAWRKLKDDHWAEKVSLGSFYEYTWPVPRTELVSDFVEGFQYIRGEKTEYTTPIRATVRGVPVEITSWTIQQALGIEGSRIAPIPKASGELDPRYMRMFGLSRADHKTDGTRINGFDDPYQDRVRALVEIMCVKKKSLYASNELLENMYQAVKKGNHNWAPLILSSLRRMLIRVHTSPTREIKGAELIDTLLKMWFPDEEQYVDPEPDQESEEEQDDSEGQPDLTPIRPEEPLPPDGISGEGSKGTRRQILTRGKKQQEQEADLQDSPASGKRTRKNKRKMQSSPSTTKEEGTRFKRLRRTEKKPRYRDSPTESLDSREAEEIEKGAITSNNRRTPKTKEETRRTKEKEGPVGGTPGEISRTLLTLRTFQEVEGSKDQPAAAVADPSSSRPFLDQADLGQPVEKVRQSDTLSPRNLGAAFLSTAGGKTEVTMGLERLMEQMRTLVTETGRLKDLQLQQERLQPTYDELWSRNQELEGRTAQLSTQLCAAGQELSGLKTTWAETRKKLTVVLEEQRKERARWAVQGGEMENRRRQRLELELKLNARLQDYDRLALENQQLRRQLEVAEKSASPASRGLTLHLLATSKKQISEELKAYGEDQDRLNRYLLRFVEAYPTFPYWSDEERNGTEGQVAPQSTPGLEEVDRTIQAVLSSLGTAEGPVSGMVPVSGDLEVNVTPVSAAGPVTVVGPDTVIGGPVATRTLPGPGATPPATEETATRATPTSG